MNKGRVIGLLKQYGDGILTIGNPKKETAVYYLCTLDFKNQYIKNRTKRKKPWPKNKTDIVVFNWTDNKYSILNPEIVTKVTPLSEILGNKS